MNNSVMVFDEPELEFGYEQRTVDPRDGLSLFGPYDLSSAKPINYVLLGTKEGVSKFKQWSYLLSYSAVDTPKGNQRLWTPYPGFKAAFGVDWPVEPVWTYELDAEKLANASQHSDKYQRAFTVVNAYLEGMRIASERDERIGVAICVVPENVWKNCRPKSVIRTTSEVISTKRIKSRKSGQYELFNSFDVEQYWMSTDFRRQLKARGMEFDFPIQIVRESTLRPDSINKFGLRGLTPLSDRLWNLSATVYYKCGGKPWKLVTAREGVCYIGIAFKRVEEESTTACCAAQMFLDTGDGVVFLGKFGPWYSPEENQFHLDKETAKNLLEGILKTYEDQGGKPLKEIFLHSRSLISEEEFEGYQAACPQGVSLTGIRVRIDDNHTHLFRNNRMPVLRGTFWKIKESAGLLWANGFKPRLATYNGWDLPIPLRIDIERGTQTTIERVAQDILSLTKLNYNACHLGDSEPVTIGFSDAVGEILISNPRVSRRRPNFKYYI
ncbi:MAG: argonaute/piwi family protein [Chloroflexota bacterium]